MMFPAFVLPIITLAVKMFLSSHQSCCVVLSLMVSEGGSQVPSACAQAHGSGTAGTDRWPAGDSGSNGFPGKEERQKMVTLPPVV